MSISGHAEIELGPEGKDVVVGVGSLPSSSDIEVVVSSIALEVSETSGGIETEEEGKDPFCAALVVPS